MRHRIEAVGVLGAGRALLGGDIIHHANADLITMLAFSDTLVARTDTTRCYSVELLLVVFKMVALPTVPFSEARPQVLLMLLLHAEPVLEAEVAPRVVDVRKRQRPERPLNLAVRLLLLIGLLVDEIGGHASTPQSASNQFVQVDIVRLFARLLAFERPLCHHHIRHICERLGLVQLLLESSGSLALSQLLLEVFKFDFVPEVLLA